MASIGKVFIVCLLVVVCCSDVSCATCKLEDIPVVENFDMSKLMGVWYEAYWKPPHFEKPEEVWVDYVEVLSATEDADLVNAKAHGRPKDGDCGTFNKQYKKQENQPAGKWYTPRYINETYSFPLDQWFLGTNYESWILVYGCTIPNEATGECDSEAAWIWSNKPTLSPEDKASAEALLPALCLTIDDFKLMPVGEECEREDKGTSGSACSSLALLVLLVSIVSSKILH